jgi:hypothetical protein
MPCRQILSKNGRAKETLDTVLSQQKTTEQYLFSFSVRFLLKKPDGPWAFSRPHLDLD